VFRNPKKNYKKQHAMSNDEGFHQFLKPLEINSWNIVCHLWRLATSLSLSGCGGTPFNVIEVNGGNGPRSFPQFASGDCTQLRLILNNKFPLFHDISNLDVGT
jgi:hypothetical protein